MMQAPPMMQMPHRMPTQFGGMPPFGAPTGSPFGMPPPSFQPFGPGYGAPQAPWGKSIFNKFKFDFQRKKDYFNLFYSSFWF